MDERDPTVQPVDESRAAGEILAEGRSLVPKDLKPPEGIPESEIEAMRGRAVSIAEALLKAPEDRSAVREVTRLGEDIESTAGGEFRLLRTSLGKVMDRMKKGEKGIPNDLKRLREIMDEINPYPAIEQLKRAQTAGFFSRLFRRVPGIGKILADIAQRYESIQTQIDAIIQSLEAGSDRLLENSLELEERYKNLKALQREIKVRAYQLQIVFNRLEEAKRELTGPPKLPAVEKAMVRIIRRLQNLRVTENAFVQFFITMNVTMDNHENLRDAVRSMTGLTRPVLENGLALKIAQQEERQIAQALAASQDYLGHLMVAIAEGAMADAAVTAEVTNMPLIKLQDLVRSYKVLMTRMDEAAQIEAKMVEAAKQNIAQLETMTTELEERVKTQEDAREVSRRADV